jgi:TetR/AcrR family transcriptional regulator, transcriptional repressor for nem operon
MGRPPASARSDVHERLLEVATELMMKRGYAGFSFGDLAERVDVSTTAIHHYFPTKADLGVAISKRYVDNAIAAVAGIDLTMPSRERLESFFAVLRGLLDQGRMCLCGMTFADAELVPKQMSEHGARFVNAACLFLESFVPASSNRRRRAQLLFSALEGSLLISRGLSRPSTFEEVCSEIIFDLNL